MGSNKKELGDLGEDIAARYLRDKGYRILGSKFRCPLGEIDLIAKTGKVLVFIEVRTRKSGYIDPEDTVTLKKQKKLSTLAKYYMERFNIEADVRFDVVGISFEKNDCKIEHLESAFEAPEDY